MCRARRIEIEAAIVDNEGDQLPAFKARIVRAMTRGELVVSEDGDPVYTPPVPGAKPLTFHPPTGATFIAMDASNGKEAGQFGRMVSVIADMTRTSKGEIAKLPAPDFQLGVTLASLFLAPR